MPAAEKEIYRRLYEAQPKPRLFSAPWWLDAVCGDGGWDAVIARDDMGEPVAALPYHITRLRGLKAAITPSLTPVIPVTGMVNPGVIATLFHAMPVASVTDLSIAVSPELIPADDGFTTTLKYTYIIPARDTIEHVRHSYNEGLKRNLRQAEKEYAISPTDDSALLLALVHASFAQRSMSAPHWMTDVIPRAFRALALQRCGQILVARADETILAGIGIAWDHDACYYLAGGRIAGDMGASAHALLLDHAIALAQERGLAFDFEGSMHPGIANFFQSFGAVPVAFPRVRRFRMAGRIWSLFHG